MNLSERKVLQRFLVICILMLYPLLGQAQYISYWYAEPNIGLSIFFGDIKQNNLLPGKGEWRLGYGIKAGRQFSYVFGLEANFLYGKLAGNSEKFDKKFYADYYETTINATINLSNLFTWDKRSDKKINFFLFVGVGYTQHNSKLIQISTGDTLRSVGYGNGAGVKGRTLEGVYIYGASLSYNISKKFAVKFETANRGMMSDYLDGSPTGYHKDGYNYTALSFTWKFGHKEDHRRRFAPKPKKKQNTSKSKSSVKTNTISKSGSNNYSGSKKEQKKSVTDISSYEENSGVKKDVEKINLGENQINESLPNVKKQKKQNNKETDNTPKKVKSKKKYKGYSWKKGQGWLKKKKVKKDKYNKFKNDWK